MAGELAMTADGESRVREYLAAVESLYVDVERWVAGFAVVERRTTTLNEQAGRYDAVSLSIHPRSAEQTAAVELRPIGASIIGARGRVDLIGRLGSRTFVYLPKGGPTFHSSVSSEGKVLESRATPVLRGVDRDGWYWIEDARRGRALPVEETLFLELLIVVSAIEI
jgi:hypothetical protein